MPILISANNGTTSACAENTCAKPVKRTPPWNYLRVRGEYPPNFPTVPSTPELPPRARRIHFTSGFDRHFRGTTSACAENTRTRKNPI